MRGKTKRKNKPKHTSQTTKHGPVAKYTKPEDKPTEYLQHIEKHM
jgi:hypothetical protein